MASHLEESGLDELELDPDRFEPSKKTLIVDRFMNRFIRIGGILIIGAVLGIFGFILFEILPLFQEASVKAAKTAQLPEGNYVEIGIDEWAELPFAIRSDGTFVFIDVAHGNEVREYTPNFEKSGEDGADVTLVTAIRYDAGLEQAVLGTSDGNYATVELQFATEWEGDDRRIVHDATLGENRMLSDLKVPIQSIDLGQSKESLLVAGIQQQRDQYHLNAVRLTRQKSLFGEEKFELDRRYDLTGVLNGRPVELLVSSAADQIVVLLDTGRVAYFYLTGDEFVLRQEFTPFEDLDDPTVAEMGFLLGDVSLVFGSVTGENRVFSLYQQGDQSIRQFGQIKAFPNLSGAATFFAPSLRNKAFLTGNGDTASLRYSTTETVRWEETLPFTVSDAAINKDYDHLLFLDSKSQLHLYELDDPHPESSLRAFFGKVWYEGHDEPAYEWQSTGGTDAFEPKLSMIPLIFGTFKGTFYAMLFALPIAILAALYTSQFMHPDFRAVVKPVMEVMASLPSVVLGFLGALWLAPILETRVPSVILIVVLVPLVGLLFGGFWGRLPARFRQKIRPGWEFIAFFPILILVMYVGWQLGPWLEKMVFTVHDPATDQVIADFRRWWTQRLGEDFDQRNSMIVGFMMGFLVIPIIFTIAEDALSNVPASLRSASLACGASRWQTAFRIVLPTASAGIFSAFLIGFGRAVGETMIVVMATGNTPIMDWNIFNGMRTLSANLAVELPEAPQYSTLFRALFLGAMILFIITFITNTAAELARQYLREKYQAG